VAVLRRQYPSAAIAEQVRRAVAADDPAYIHGSVEGATLEIRVDASSARSLRATLDDLLACVQVAERSLQLEEHDSR
jgi:Transcription factor Pcc1